MKGRPLFYIRWAIGGSCQASYTLGGWTGWGGGGGGGGGSQAQGGKGTGGGGGGGARRAAHGKGKGDGDMAAMKACQKGLFEQGTGLLLRQQLYRSKHSFSCSIQQQQCLSLGH